MTIDSLLSTSFIPILVSNKRKRCLDFLPLRGTQIKDLQRKEFINSCTKPKHFSQNLSLLLAKNRKGFAEGDNAIFLQSFALHVSRRVQCSALYPYGVTLSSTYCQFCKLRTPYCKVLCKTGPFFGSFGRALH